jgi:hypothetical protein
MFPWLFGASLSAPANLTGYVLADSSIGTRAGWLADGDCWGSWRPDINTTGWYQLNLEGRPGLPPLSMGRCVGFVEGVLIADSLWFAYLQYLNQTGPPSPALLDFYNTHLRWINSSVEAFQDVPYWRQIGAIYNIFLGIYNGYQSVNLPKGQGIDFLTFYSYVAIGDSMELRSILHRNFRYDENRMHCTALIKLSPDERDIYFAHDTWTDYRSLHWVLIHYNLPLPEFAAPRVTLSTQLGLVSSPDDFFITSQGLLIFETTINVRNISLYDNYITPQSVLNWMRTAVAAFTSTNVTDWENAFLRHNSGTYNDEYYVVDSKLLNQSNRVSSNLVHAITSVPGPLRFIQDLTTELYDEGFLVSLNVPRNPEAAHYIEWDAYVNTSTTDRGACDYYKCPRYLIAKRESKRLSHWDAFMRFMRYGGYKRDGFSLWHGIPYHVYCISARGDTDDDPALRNSHGGLNSKACKASEALTSMKIYGVNAPSFQERDQNWPLNWGVFPLNETLHLGMPEVWDFNWIATENGGFRYCERFGENECEKTNFCGWCGSDKKCIAGDKDGPFYGVKCSSRWKALGKGPDIALIVGLSVGGAVIVAVVIVVVIVALRKRKPDCLNPH